MKNILFLFVLIIGFMFSSNAQSSTLNNAPEKLEKIIVFPNPATTVVTVLGLRNTEKAFIIVFDIYGNSILQHQWEIKNKALNIPVANLEKGIYVISILSKEQKVKTKFYKQ